MSLSANPTAKELVRLVFPDARLASYELLRRKDRPCYFIHLGKDGPPISRVCGTRSGAWRDAAGNYAPKRSRAGGAQ